MLWERGAASDAQDGTAVRCSTLAPTPRSASESTGAMAVPELESSWSRTTAHHQKFRRMPATGVACEESSSAEVRMENGAGAEGVAEKERMGTWAQPPMRATNSALMSVSTDVGRILRRRRILCREEEEEEEEEEERAVAPLE
jgi:hypothetical protein